MKKQKAKGNGKKKGRKACVYETKKKETNLFGLFND